MQYINVDGIKTILDKIKSKIEFVKYECSSEISKTVEKYPKKTEFKIKSINGMNLFDESEYIPKSNEIYLEFSEKPSIPPSAMITIQDELQANDHFQYNSSDDIHGYILTFDYDIKKIESVLTFGTKLIKIVLPDSVTSFGYEAFNGCSSLREINIPDKITRIDPNLFAGCTCLDRIHLGKNITQVDPNTFIDSTEYQMYIYVSSNEICFDNCFSKDITGPIIFFETDNPKFSTEIWINDEEHCSNFYVCVPKNLEHVYKKIESFDKWTIQIWDSFQKDLQIESDSQQSDWNETDETSPAFIKNKPSFTTDGLEEQINKLREDLDTLVSGDTSEAIESFNEIIAFLDGIKDSTDLDGIIGAIEAQISALQKLIESVPYDKTTDTLTVANLKGNADTATKAKTVTVGTGSNNVYRPIVVNNGGSLYTGSATFNYVTGDIKSTSFTTNGGKFIGDLNGHADSATDLTGHNEATEEEFNFRASAGEKSIKDDTARIEKVKGNSVVWNMMLPVVNTNNLIQNVQRINFTVVDNECVGVFVNSGLGYIGYKEIYLSTSDLYFISFQVESEKPVTVKIGTYATQNYSAGHSGGKKTYNTIYINTRETSNTILYGVTPDDSWVAGDTVVFSKMTCINLTKMFGAGNEPTTIEEFYQRIPVGVDLNTYEEGRIVNGNYDAIKTTGFNQWDEQWEVGDIWTSNGTDREYSNMIRSKNYIPILPNTKYIVTCDKFLSDQNVRTRFYDADKSFLGVYQSNGGSVLYNTEFTTPVNAHYMRFSIVETYGATYNNDICINLSHTGYRDGEYEPYKEFIHNLSWIKKYFPNGMCSAGSAHDEIRFNSTTQKWEAVQNVGVVDLGSLSWNINEVEQVYMAQANNLASTDNILSELFEAVSRKTALAAMENRQVKTHSSKPNYLYCKNTAYTDVATFQSAMQGVMLNYELAEPIIKEITEVVDMTYNVYDFGTEKLIQDGESTPFIGNIVYQFNAVDRIRDNERNIKVLKDTFTHDIEQVLELAGRNSFVDIDDKLEYNEVF